MSIFTEIWNIPKYLGYAAKALKIKSTISEAVAAFPGFSADDGNYTQLKTWLDKYIPSLTEWAGWTPITLDDQAVAVLRLLINDYWAVILSGIEAIQGNKEVNVQELAASVQDTHDRLLNSSATDVEPEEALTVVLCIVSVIRCIVEIRRAKREKKEEVITPEVTPVRKRPVIDFFKRLFS
ncbi:MAG: hypothetical protein LBT89_02075 [Planctomycetaceae bacterium]|jgi:hypothetical protein|nr:hypothetical protein [Planctomycetaceae bacterium]